MAAFEKLNLCSTEPPNDHYQRKAQTVTTNAESKRSLSTQSLNHHCQRRVQIYLYQCRAQIYHYQRTGGGRGVGGGGAGRGEGGPSVAKSGRWLVQ
jgi:hypothetical protein